MKITGTNMTMIRGDTESILVRRTDKNAAPVPFGAGDTVYFTVKASVYRTENLLQKKITQFSTEGAAVVNLLAAETKMLDYGTYVYDIQHTDASGHVKTLVPPSDFTVAGEVTYE